MQPANAAGQNGASAHIEVFRYAASAEGSVVPVWQGWNETSASADASEHPAPAAAVAAEEAARRAESEARMADEARKAFEVGRERGRQEGRQAEREAQAGALATAAQQRVRQVVELVESFAAERGRFFHEVEQEVVELALGIAARILRREAQMDPLLLSGAVRVALGQLSASTEVRLRVPEPELAMWREALALFPNLALRPSVAAGEGMRLGDCLIETELGSVDLGLRAQLGEIERGFFDRAGTSRSSHPAAAHPSAAEPGMEP